MVTGVKSKKLIEIEIIIAIILMESVKSEKLIEIGEVNNENKCPLLL